MEYSRWYDKNPEMQEVFKFIETLDFESKKSISQEILQILINEFNLNMDEKITDISKNYDYTCKRWYDENIDLYTSFELIKQLTKAEQTQIVNKIITTILFMYIEGEQNA